MKKIILLILCSLFGLMMLNSGLNKLFNYMPMPELTPEQLALFGAMVTLKWLIPMVGITEIIGGVLIVIPKTRALGAIVILPVMVGIVVHHAVHDPSTIIIGAVMLAINLWAIIDNKDKYLPMIG